MARQVEEVREDWEKDYHGGRAVLYLHEQFENPEEALAFATYMDDCALAWGVHLKVCRTANVSGTTRRHPALARVEGA